MVEEGIVDEHTYTFYPSSLDQGETYYWRVKVGSALYTDSRSFSLSELVIGDSFGGGIVFYLDGAGGGLVCAEHDQGIDIEWGESGTDIGGDDNSSAPELEGVGSGLANTEAIVAALGDNGGTPYAAKICYDLDLNGYTDWFLPSAEELTLMYEDLHLQGYGDFRSEDYWSSTENTSSYAWWHDFGSSNHGISLKFNEYCVRAVRAF